jgi:nitrogen regulatory protein PII
VHLLVAVIEDSEKVEPILETFYESGMSGATVLESMGMGHAIAAHYSIFSRFADLNGSRQGQTHNRVIFTVVETEEILERAVEIIRKVVGDLNRPDTGLLFTVPLDRVEGFNTPLGEE